MTPRDPLVRRLLDCACAYSGIPEADLLADIRKRRPSSVRFAIWHVAYNYGPSAYSTPHLGLLLGGRDHTTVLNGLKRAKERLADGDKWFTGLVTELQKVKG